MCASPRGPPFRLRRPQNVPIPVSPHADRNEHRDIADFAAPASFQAHPIEIDIRIGPGDGPLPPGVDLFVDALVEPLTAPELTRVPQSASVMSSTRRTLTPARYISTSASSTYASRRRYRSMIAVSNGNVRSLGTFSVTSPAFVFSLRS